LNVHQNADVIQRFVKTETFKGEID